MWTFMCGHRSLKLYNMNFVTATDLNNSILMYASNTLEIQQLVSLYGHVELKVCTYIDNYRVFIAESVKTLVDWFNIKRKRFSLKYCKSNCSPRVIEILQPCK